MSNLLRQHEVETFLCSIVVINALFVTACAEGFLPDALYNYGRFALLGSALALVVYLSRGGEAIWELFRPLRRWRVAPKWYALALIWAGMVGIFVLSAKLLLTDLSFSELELQFSVVTNPRILMTLIIGASVGEIVWISYSIKHLTFKHTTFAASLIVGVFWTLWWFPMAYYNYGIIPGLTLAPLLINQVGVALACGLFYYHTRSALCVLLLQVGVNTTILVLPVLPTTGGEMTYWAFSISYFLAACLGYLVLGPQPRLFKSDKSPERRLVERRGHLGVMGRAYSIPTTSSSR